MGAGVIVDTGPIVAWLNRNDEHHEWAKHQFSRLAPPLVTCEPVLSEAVFLAQRAGDTGTAVVALVSKGVLRVTPVVQEESEALAALMRRYNNLTMSLADACLVRLSELIETAVVFTLDSDFMLYRRRGRLVIPTLMPPQS